MGKDGANSNSRNLSSKKGSPVQKRGSGSGSLSRTRACSVPDLAKEVERLRTTLEVERTRNQQAQGRHSLELRRQQDKAKGEQERALRELTFRHEQQKALELLRQREALGRERAVEIRHLLGRQGQDRQCLDCATFRQAGNLQRRLADEISGIGTPMSHAKAGKDRPGCKGNGAIYRKLEELLKTLHGVAEGDQSVLLQRLLQEVELERSYFLCHLLEAHGHAAKEGVEVKEAEGQKRSLVKLSRPKSKSCVHLQSGLRDRLGSSNKRKTHACRSRSLSQQPQHVSFLPVKPSKQDLPEKGKNIKEELLGTISNQSSPDVSWDLRSSSPSLEKSSPSRCSEDIMDDMVSELSVGVLWICLLFGKLVT